MVALQYEKYDGVTFNVRVEDAGSGVDCGSMAMRIRRSAAEYELVALEERDELEDELSTVSLHARSR